MDYTENKSNSILTVLRSQYNCTEIRQFLYIKGLEAAGKEVCTEVIEYHLKNCECSNPVKETKRVNNILKKKIKGYEKIARLSLQFFKKKNINTIIINNGEIQ